MISAIQRLHASPTLNKLLREADTVPELLKPLKLYADGESDSVLYKLINEAVSTLPLKPRHGYPPKILLIYYLCPLIYETFPDAFIDILTELHIYRSNFNGIRYVYEDIIKYRYPLVSNEVNEYVNGYTKMYVNLPDDYSVNPFVSGILEIIPDKDVNGGHAVALIKSQTDGYVVIDDDQILPLSVWYQQRKEHIYEISVNDITLREINGVNRSIMGSCSPHPEHRFEARVTRFVLNCGHVFDYPEINRMDKERFVPIIMIALAVVALIVLIVVIVSSSKGSKSVNNMSHEYAHTSNLVDPDSALIDGHKNDCPIGANCI